MSEKKMEKGPRPSPPESYRDVSGELGYRSQEVTGEDGHTHVRLVPKNPEAQAKFEQILWDIASGR